MVDREDVLGKVDIVDMLDMGEIVINVNMVNKVLKQIKPKLAYQIKFPLFNHKVFVGLVFCFPYILVRWCLS